MSKLQFDPKILPIESLAGEAAVLAEELSAERLRNRFANPPAWAAETIEERLLRVRDGNPTPASVLMLTSLHELETLKALLESAVTHVQMRPKHPICH